jgi:hypothetical protein
MRLLDEWDLGPDGRSSARRAVDHECAVEDGDPIDQAAKAGSVHRIGPARAVVGDDDDEHGVFALRAHA